MNCQEFEEQIVLFAELSEAERSHVERHIASCASCRAFFESMSAVNGRVQNAGMAVPVLKDPAGMTNRIMLRIENKRQSAPGLTLQYARYAMAAVSVFFIFFLGIELLHVPTQPHPLLPVAQARSVVLDNAKFKVGLKNKKSTKLLMVSGCVNPFRIKVDEACLRERLAAYKTFSN